MLGQPAGCGLVGTSGYKVRCSRDRCESSAEGDDRCFPKLLMMQSARRLRRTDCLQYLVPPDCGVAVSCFGRVLCVASHSLTASLVLPSAVVTASKLCMLWVMVAFREVRFGEAYPVAVLP
jgi:hypothetical protein